MRCFIALNISNKNKELIEEKLLSLIDEKKFRKVKEKNLHLTMRFLGEIPEKKAIEIKEKIQKIEFDEFEIELNKVKSFGSRVLWIDVASGKEKIMELDKKLEQTGLSNERFHPHLTIARNKKASVDEVTSLIEELNKKELKLKEKICSMDLMKSELTSIGPKYAFV
jgi:2'-5' RNA ligase